MSLYCCSLPPLSYIRIRIRVDAVGTRVPSLIFSLYLSSSSVWIYYSRNRRKHSLMEMEMEMEMERGRRRNIWFSDNNDKAVFEQIMQRFRPIVPKPATTCRGRESGSSSVKGSDREETVLITKETVVLKNKKRKYVRSAASSKCKNLLNLREKEKEKEKERDSIFTLQLLPAADELPVVGGGRKEEKGEEESQTSLNTSLLRRREPLILLDRTVVTVVETVVTVERVTGNCMDVDGRGLGCTDEEMIMNLESDTCPGFISDGENYNVKWVNMAYRRMVMWEWEWEDDDDDDDDEKHKQGAPPPPPQVVVKVVAMRDLGELTRLVRSFACWVRVKYYCYNCLGKQYYCSRQIVVPCDVWKMEFGGLAWRLDVPNSLSLGPPPPLSSSCCNSPKLS